MMESIHFAGEPQMKGVFLAVECLKIQHQGDDDIGIQNIFFFMIWGGQKKVCHKSEEKMLKHLVHVHCARIPW